MSGTACVYHPRFIHGVAISYPCLRYGVYTEYRYFIYGVAMLRPWSNQPIGLSSLSGTDPRNLHQPRPFARLNRAHHLIQL